ncbi:MAG: arginine deiminase family protein [Elusimicrobiales bacterium]|jgi:N-dimethylarginine dimethylaminohydrolase
MNRSWKKFSAYQGAGWRPRDESMALELARSAAPRVNSEYGVLKAVLLYCPGKELSKIKDPNLVQHLARIDPGGIRREYAALNAVFRMEGAAVHILRTGLERPGRGPAFNLMYVRDLFFNTLEGAVVARMAGAARAGEESLAVPALVSLGIPINKMISGAGLFEGADALWLNEKTVLCGTGNRTNALGFLQLRQSLALQGVNAVETPLPDGVQHLLGLLQIVDRNLALLRTKKAPNRLKAVLRRYGIDIIPVPETDEVGLRQGMNIVTVAPRRIIMPARCPGLKKLYLSAGLSVAAEVGIGQLINGAGGLACAAGILSREVRD